MNAWIEVAFVAFVAQLAVLPGEKVQFIIAGLSTRFNPLLVVGAAGSAFAGWTVLEIVLGNYLQELLPQLYLDVLAGLMFLVFAYLLVRTAPDAGGETTDEAGEILDADARAVETDGGLLATREGELDVRVPIVGWRVPTPFGGFLPIFAMMAFGEFGDKTQLVTITLATRYAHPSAIWVGEMAAIIPVSLFNAVFFHRFSHRFDVRKAHYVGAALFAFFGVDTLQATVTGVSVWETVVSTVGHLLAAVVTGA